MKRFYYWMLQKAGHPHAWWYLGAISFAESSVSPFPPDPLMVPMVLQNKEKAWSIAFLTTVTSVIGGVVGYGIGLFLFETLGLPILKTYGLEAKFALFQETFYRWGFWAIVIKALTPIPFKLVTITCGALKFNFTLFVIASTLSRGLRFYGMAALLKRFGPSMQKVIEKNIQLVAWSFIGLLIGGFFLVKYVI